MTGTRPTPRLMVVADLAYAGSERRLLAVVESLAPVAADPRIAIQLRAKDLDGASLEVLARAVRVRLPAEALVVVNGASEVAADLGWGAHWPEHDLPEQLPPGPIWHSAAVHSLDALHRAEGAGVDAVVFGSVFEPGSKEGAAAGLDALRAVCRAARVPVIAIGGITPARVRDCLEAGAHGVAVVSGILGTAHAGWATGWYLDALASNTEQVEVER